MHTPENRLPQTRRCEVHGHRGCRGLRPENTIPAFSHAVALGVDVIELDVVISQDQQVVVSHEPWLAAKLGRDNLGRTIDPAQELQHNLYQLPYASIRQCVVGEWPHPDFATQLPFPSYRPLLREVLGQVARVSQHSGRLVGFSVEVKSSPAGDDIFHPQPAQFVDLVVTELMDAGVINQTTILSFDPRILQATRRAYPALRLCLLVEDYLSPIAGLFDTLGFNPDVFGPDFQLLSAATVRDIRAAYPQLQIVPWTVNTAADMARVQAWQVDGITTDYPDRLLSLSRAA